MIIGTDGGRNRPPAHLGDVYWASYFTDASFVPRDTIIHPNANHTHGRAAIVRQFLTSCPLSTCRNQVSRSKT